ncbi:MAG: DUF108 domain-containing protein [Alphaproteobacteria bacterium]|nr:DUF108 domain-containing protein [Alphaproteobacteria bacterium]
MNAYSRKIKKTGIAGTGAIGRTVARALIKGIEGYTLTALSDLAPSAEFEAPYVSFSELSERCDLIIECLPMSAVPALAKCVFAAQKDLILISSGAMILYPELQDIHKQSTSRIYAPSGAIAGLDGIRAMREMGIQKCKIVSTKRPQGFSTAPYILQNALDVDKIDTKIKLFEGSALEAIKGFPANINVAASLSIAAGTGPENTHVEIWADPAAQGNRHEIFVQTAYSQLEMRIENLPDPENPKSSVLAARSIIACLRNMNNLLTSL